MAKKNEYINEQLKYENQDEFNRLIQRTREKRCFGISVELAVT